MSMTWVLWYPYLLKSSQAAEMIFSLVSSFLFSDPLVINIPNLLFSLMGNAADQHQNISPLPDLVKKILGLPAVCGMWTAASSQGRHMNFCRSFQSREVFLINGCFSALDGRMKVC
jgi:hypothetical protein